MTNPAPTRRVLRWEVPVDDRAHVIGGGRVVHVDCRPTPGSRVAGRIEVWTEESTAEGEAPQPGCSVQVFGTGQPLPANAVHPVGSALDADGALVWHVYVMNPEVEYR